MDQAESMQQRVAGFFPEMLGITFVTVTLEKVVAEMAVRDNLCTVPGVLHGGAVMAFADTLGAVGTAMNLRPGAGTTTLESKTNFFAAGRAGTIIRGESVPLHRGRRTMVWQTNVLSNEGKLLAQVTQTQIILES